MNSLLSSLALSPHSLEIAIKKFTTFAGCLHFHRQPIHQLLRYHDDETPRQKIGTVSPSHERTRDGSTDEAAKRLFVFPHLDEPNEFRLLR